ncbi:MAG: PilZ domain-containing protein [Deltaproteobacteria bacterium]|nr:PilZ domain-containing protein [Deltaproteobacteria bacterium]
MDKREAVRVPVRVHARCRCHDGVVINGTVEDLSRSGLFLRADLFLGQGSPAEIDLDVPGEETLHLTAEVVRVDDGGMAFRFCEQPSRSLANFIMRQHQQIEPR